MPSVGEHKGLGVYVFTSTLNYSIKELADITAHTAYLYIVQIVHNSSMRKYNTLFFYFLFSSLFFFSYFSSLSASSYLEPRGLTTRIPRRTWSSNGLMVTAPRWP